LLEHVSAEAPTDSPVVRISYRDTVPASAQRAPTAIRSPLGTDAAVGRNVYRTAPVASRAVRASSSSLGTATLPSVPLPMRTSGLWRPW
jgi:hypothetical protein